LVGRLPTLEPWTTVNHEEGDEAMPDHEDCSTLTVEEAARRLGISRKHAYGLAAADRLPVPTIRLGRRLVVPRLALERLLAGYRRSPGDGGADDHSA
jgi:excisionase family DNA binding protein